MQLPNGFAAVCGNIGVKDETDDCVIVWADRQCSVAGVFTQSRFAGPSVEVSRRAVADGRASALVVLSKNANVANGPQGERDAEELASLAAAVASAGSGSEDPAVAAGDVVVASTGVIGRPYPMDRIRLALGAVASGTHGGVRPTTDAEDLARGIMTTDTHHKCAERTVGSAQVVAIAKGVGMIEPDMATMLTFAFTDAAIEPDPLDALWRRVVAPTFNSLSVDTDTSTSDTAVVMASGAAGVVDEAALETALFEVCLELTKMLARDGEGASKLLEVTASGAVDVVQAKTVAKSIVNSPLVKTAVHGADPNWGRVAMAVGKVNDPRIDQNLVRIEFGGMELYPAQLDADALARLEEYLGGETVEISVDLGLGEAAWTVYGCDLSDGYVRINADYTT